MGLPGAALFCNAAANFPGCHGATLGSLIPVAQSTAGILHIFAHDLTLKLLQKAGMPGYDANENGVGDDLIK
jgi:hypothetical protein